MKKLLFFTSILILNSCGQLNPIRWKSDKTPYEKADVLTYEEIKGNETFVAGSLVLTPNLEMLKPSPEVVYDVGGEFRFHHLKFGEVIGNYSRPISYRNSHSFENIISERSLPQNQYSALISIPFVKTAFYKKEHISPGHDDQNNNYFIIGPTNGLRKINARLGYYQDYRRSFTNAYSIILEENYNNVSFYSGSSPYAENNQLTQFFRIGVSLQNCFNTKLTVKSKDNVTIYGKSTFSTSFYFDVLLLMGNQSDIVEYEYSVNDGITITGYTEMVDLTNHLNKVPIGFAVGYETIDFSGRRKFMQGGQFFELGFQPGYFNSYSSSFYIKAGIRTGFGSWK